MDLDSLRQSIDDIDNDLVKLLNARAKVSLDIGQAKRDKLQGADTTHVYVPTREKAVFEKLNSINTGPLKSDSLIAIYREIISSSRSLQKQITVSYLGPAGSFTHQAALGQFGEGADYIAQTTIADIYEAVEKGQTLYGVAPFENSTHGSVIEALDTLRSYSAAIRAETYLNIRQNLLSTVSDLKQIKKVYSHPQGFGQTSKWLQANLPGVQRVPVSSTSQAAKNASEETNSAAICPLMCADVYHLNILQESIEDEKDNCTRFFVLASASDVRPPRSSTADAKTLIRFTVDHRQPGALCDSLRVFKTHNINLTKIDSRPSLKRLWQYYFFVEFEGYQEDENVGKALEELKEYTLESRVLGSYPSQEPQTTV